MWNISDWQFVERQVVTDPKGREWSVALMDLLGQKGDPDRPSEWLELQYSSGRYFTLVYSASGAIQREHGYQSLTEAAQSYERLLHAIVNGTLDPSQPLFREDLED
jgi:hypothetical protein